MKAYDYSQGFVDSMLQKAATKGLRNLVACAGDSHKQKELYPDMKFDLIFGCNLIDRLHTPQQWIEQSKVEIVSEYQQLSYILFRIC